MSLNVAEIAETLELNSEELKGNRMLTNEIIVDDIMLGLGYNKKRDKQVQRLYTGVLDWVAVSTSGRKLAVKVFAYDEDALNNEELTEALNFCLEKRYSVVIVTDGAQLAVFRYDKVKAVYISVSTLNLKGELTEQEQNVIKAISKDTFDTDYLDSLTTPQVSLDKAYEIIESNKQDIVSGIVELIDTAIPSCGNSLEQAEAIVNKILSRGETEEGTSKVDKAEQNEVDTTQYTERISELESEVNRLNGLNTSKDNSIEQLNTKVDNLETELTDTKSSLEQHKETITTLNSKIVELKQELDNMDSEDNIKELGDDLKPDVDESVINELTEEIESKNNEIEKLNGYVEDLENKLNNQSAENKSKIKELEDNLAEKDAKIKELTDNAKSGSGTPSLSGDMDEAVRNKLDSYIAQIRELSVKLSDAEDERDEAYKKVEEMKKEVEELSGSDLRKAEQLLGVIEDDVESDRNYVAVINTELMQFDEIHTFIGRCLQKLYDIKNFEASQYIFNGDVFKLNGNSNYNDIVMNNKAYDIVISSANEDEELNKLRIVFSHFSDVIFLCKKIGTLRQPIDARDSLEIAREEVHLESDEYLDEQQFSGDGAEGYQQFNGDSGQFAVAGDESQFGDGQFAGEAGQFTGEAGQFNKEGQFEGNQEGYYGEEGQMPMIDGEQMPEMPDIQGQGYVPGFDDGEGWTNQQEQLQMERRLLVGQLLNIDMLIWTDQNVKFNTIKYISTNMITFGINTSSDSYDMLLCKCIDAVLAIEAFNGSIGLINKLKQKDFSKANNFLRLYSPEYAGHPRINGTKYVIVGLESAQQVASALLDVCNIMGIDTNEIFLYFDAETNSQYIIENYDFSEDAIRIAETNSYIMDDEVEPRMTTAIIKGDMFNHIVVTKNSLKVHKEIFNKALAIKTKYLAKTIDSMESVVEIISNMLNEAHNNNIQINYKAIGNVIGESCGLLSMVESDVSENHYTINVFGDNIYCSSIEDWQIPHSLIKVHTTLFNNTAIAIKTSVNADAINFYGRQFETSEPSLGLAVNSFVDYVSSCVKE